MKKVAISQSNYIPWKGYFDMINSVDEFIIYDDMQYTKRDWRNRNIIKTPNGLLWLTIPVKIKGKFFQKINETEVENNSWATTHWKSIQMNYSKTPFFSIYAPMIEKLYSDASQETFLSKVNYIFLQGICNILEINTLISQSSQYDIIDGKTERLVSICKQAQASEYISGPAAKDYIDPKQFEDVHIQLKWMNYQDYAPYPQKFGDFNHGVTILDLLFNVGPEYKKFLKSFSGVKTYE